MNEREQNWLERIGLIFTLGLSAAVLNYIFTTGSGTGSQLGRFSSGWTAALLLTVAVILTGLVLLGLSLTKWAGFLSRVGSGFVAWLSRLGWLNWIGLAGISAGLGWLIFRSQPDRLGAALPRWWLLWLAALLSALLIQALARRLNFYQALLGGLIYIGFFFVAAGFLLQVSDYPFSLGWSEGSRMYNASLFFAKPLYGQALPLPVLHPTRYLLQSIPFLIPGTSIWVHRLWQAGLWIVLPGVGSWLLARRLKLGNRALTWIIAGFAFLFFYQGPIYYHLMVCAIPVLIGMNARKPMRTLLLVLLASVWAGVSRVNWWPVPGALAALLFLLEERMENRNIYQYARWPFIWGVVGTLTAFAANKLYEALSGNPPEVFNSALDSPLLWDRLWPNTTYGPGVLYMALLVVFPGILWLLVRLKGPNHWHWLRLTGILGALFIFWAGGLVVSMKIGGGSNLHNLDAFLLLFGTALLYIVMERFPSDKAAAKPARFKLGFALLAVLLVMVPVAQTVYGPAPLNLPDAEKTAENLTAIQTLVAEAGVKGEVLFLTEKQLLTFKIVDAQSFDPEHEKVFLMEMAMANNQVYLQKFYDNLKNKRYSLIVAEPLNANMQDSSYAFSEENNAWVERVELPVLQYYELQKRMTENNVHLYKPKP